MLINFKPRAKVGALARKGRERAGIYIPRQKSLFIHRKQTLLASRGTQIRILVRTLAPATSTNQLGSFQSNGFPRPPPNFCPCGEKKNFLSLSLFLSISPTINSTFAYGRKKKYFINNFNINICHRAEIIAYYLNNFSAIWEKLRWEIFRVGKIARNNYS